jgi:hypothetical protein
MLIVLKSLSLNPLEPPGPFQACNGIALSLPFTSLILQYQVKFFLCLKYSVIMVSGPGAEFLVKKLLVPTE